MPFPVNPTNNQLYDDGTYTYRYNSTFRTWTKVAQNKSNVGNVITANSTVTSGTASLTANSITVGNTTILSNSVTVGNTTVSASNITLGNTTVSNSNITVGNTKVDENSITVGNTTVNNSNITIGNTVLSSSNIAIGNTIVTDNAITVGNTIVGSSNITLGNTTITGDTSNNLLSVNGNISANYFIGNGSLLTGIDASQIQNGNSNAKVYANSNITVSVSGNSNIAVFTDTGANINGYLTVSNTFTVPNTAGGATNLAMGDPSQGNLVSNAVTLTNSSSVSNAIAQMNVILGKLVPPSPPNFPANQTISISSLSSYRMANYTQTDNTPAANKSVPGGTTVNSVRRAATYNANTILNAGPGDTGTVTAFLNGADAGSRTLTSSLNGNGTYSNLVIFNNYDYSVANSNITPGFWSVFSTRAAGSVTQGWNEVYIAHSSTGNTNTANWFYDSSAPGAPVFSNTSMTAPANANLTFSSTVPHYANTNQFTVTFDVNRLSGNMYPISDTFATGTAGGAFAAPASKTYATANITTPLAQNLYVTSGNATVNTTSNIISGFGASTLGPSVTVDNSYNTGTQSLSPGANVLYKTGTTSSATRIEEANVFVGTTIGVGSGLVFRIVNPGSTDTPTYTGSELAFNSETGTLNSYDATVVANILKHDQTNYSTGYSPQGPNLSSGRTGAQYITLKFIRTSVSKFDVKWTGNIAGLWVALPGSIIDSTSGINGWIDMSVAYAGAGVPGSNIGAGGNGSNGCALGGVAPLNTAQTNKAVTATFGTVSSSSTGTNEIYVRIKLTSGQSVTALSLQGATN